LLGKNERLDLWTIANRPVKSPVGGKTHSSGLYKGLSPEKYLGARRKTRT